MELQSRLKAAHRPHASSRSLELEDASGYTRDDRDLIRLGKKPVLKRNFGFMSILGFSCTVLVTWEGMLLTSTQGLLNGGPAGIIYGFIVAWAGAMSTFLVLSELASMAPTAGGQYHWVFLLAPKSYRRFLSFITGWTTFAGWQALTASSAYLDSTLLQGVIVLANPSFHPKPWHTMLMYWAVLVFAVFINTVASKTLAHFESLILILHIIGFFATLIPLVYLGPHADASIFTTFYNEGGWSTQGLSFMVGLPAVAFSLLGSDSAIHMAEEIKDASTILPISIIASILLNGSLGFAMAIAFVFCIGDLDAAIASQATLGYPFIYVFQQATQSTAGAVVISSIVFILGVCGCVGALASASRMLWSFARDKGVPQWQTLIKLDRRTSIPVYTIALITFVSVLLSLIILGSSVAFNNIPYDPRAPVIDADNLHWGPWKVPGLVGVVNNALSLMYLLLMWFWSFWPPVTPVAPETMNFSVVTFSVVVTFGVVWYFLYGRKTYKGPIIEIELSTRHWEHLE
ncbi:putative GABA permease [Xylariaceae sp. FL0016]|nr:putative GABA permease [Xylariaceae sp. FL0016]